MIQIKKLYTKDYNEFNDNFQFILPLNLENLTREDDSVRLLSHVLEGLDYRNLYKAYSSVGKNRLNCTLSINTASFSVSN